MLSSARRAVEIGCAGLSCLRIEFSGRRDGDTGRCTCRWPSDDHGELGEPGVRQAFERIDQRDLTMQAWPMMQHRFFRSPLSPREDEPLRARPRVLGWALACAAAVFVASAAPPAPAYAQGASSQGLERRVKAAFLYKFLGYADFPAAAFADSAAPVMIGVVGSDEMAAELTQIVAGRQVRGRPIVVRALREGDPVHVHLLFIAGNDSARAARVLRAASATSAATSSALLPVTECELGLQHGSVINFRIIEERVRFDVSLDSAERNNVKLSSRLLTVANRVVKGTS